MSDLFKSAFGYFSSNNSNNSAPNNELIGQIYEIGPYKVRIKKVIAEGGFAFVFVAQALDTGKEYALKRLIAADDDAKQVIIQEINTLKKLSGHPNIIQFVAATFIDKYQNSGLGEYLLLTELCTGGSIVEVLQRLNPSGIPPEIVTKILWQCCKAVQHMHSQSPPIIHRDLKIENLLISGDGRLKLCDFGSATSQVFRPDNSWSAQQRSMLEDQMNRCTTPMYRAPEMVDTWENAEIGTAADVWAIGCLLYLMCYCKHPFEDSSSLRIINANYTLPPSDTKYKCFHGIIRACLKVQPNTRVSVNQILEQVASVAEALHVTPSEALGIENILPVQSSVAGTDSSNSSPIHIPQQQHPQQSANHSPRSHSPAQRPLNPPPHHHPPPASSGGGGLFSQIRGGAGSFLKNLKDTSTKVVQSVQQTMVRTEEMAASYITSRICVINYTEGPDTLQDLRVTIESRHSLPNCAIYNLSSAPLPTHRFPNATIVECGWSKKCPSLQAIYTLCEHMNHFLSSQPTNICFVVCSDGKRSSPFLVCAFLLFVGFVSRPQDAVQLYAVKRIPPNLTPSHVRYLEYFKQVLEAPQPTLVCHKIRIMSITIQPVPVFNKNRDGCRPFIDVYIGEDKIFSTFDEYDRMVVYNVHHGKVDLPVRCSVSGDITVVVSHARQVITRVTPIPMLKIQFNSAFTHDNVLMFSRGDLDDIDLDHFHDSLLVTMNCEETGDATTTISPWAKYKPLHPNVLFTSKLEADEITEAFASRTKVKSTPPPPRPAPPRPPPVVQRPEPPVPKQQEDLLNLGGSNVDEVPVESSAVETDDLLNLGSSGAPPTSDEPNFTPSSNPLFEPFVPESNFFDQAAPAKTENNKTANLLGDWSDDSQFSSNFADFATNLTPDIQNLNITSNGKPAATDSNQFLGTATAASNIQRNVSSPNLQSDILEDLISKPKAMSNASSPSKAPTEPNYNRSHFESAKPQPPPTTGKKIEDAFGDLLGSQGYSFSAKKDSGPRTINQMRREDQAKVTDPDKLKILDWTEGKTNNIRALLTSLHTVLWEDAKWTQCYMHQLVSPGDVKKNYRRACIAVHPDKHIGTANEKMAKMIFMELNNAWNEFEKEMG